MANNYGKAFENRFKEDFLSTVSNSVIDRLYDTTAGYKTITQISDFIGFSKPYIFYLECKSTKGNTFPISNLTQLEKLSTRIGLPGVRVGVIIWFWEKDRIFYIPAATFQKLIADGKKSFNIRTDLETYLNYEIPCQKKRVFCFGDYSLLMNTNDGD